VRPIAFHLASANGLKDILNEVINQLTKYPEWWVDRFQLEGWSMNVQVKLGLAVDHYLRETYIPAPGPGACGRFWIRKDSTSSGKYYR